MTSGRAKGVAVAVFALSLATFLGLRSNDPCSVDGPLRCLDVYERDALEFHGNNHLLYPAWVLAWSRLARALGLSPMGPMEFVHLTQALDAWLAASSLLFAFIVARRATGSSRLAFLASVVLGLSRAFVAHATNAAEPMPGFFCAAAAVALQVECQARGLDRALPLAGFLYGLALASYQSMVLVAPIAALLLLGPPAPLGAVVSRRGLRRLAWVAGGGLAAIVLVYGFAYSREGVPVRAMPARFLRLDGGASVYGGVKLSRFVNLGPGLLRNLLSAVPEDYQGVRALLGRPDGARSVALALLSAAPLALIAALAGSVVGAAWRYATKRRRTWYAALGVAGLLPFVPLLVWDPLYDKLWLQPIAILSIGSVVAVSRIDRTRRRLLVATILVTALAEAWVNLPRASAESRNPTPFLVDADLLAQSVQEDDAVVLNFDPISMLWLAFHGSRNRTLVLPASTKEEATGWLLRSRALCRQRNGRLLFIGVLDMSRRSWDPFLGDRVGIPFQLLDAERRERKVLRAFHLGTETITLSEVPLGPG